MKLLRFALGLPRGARARLLRRTGGWRVAKTAILESRERITFGQNVEIFDYVIIRPGSGVTIGNNVQINPFTVIFGGAGVHIGDDVMIAPHVTMAAGNHNYLSTTEPMRLAGDISRGPIRIEDGAWIGAGVILTDGVTVGRGAVVGAGAVVTRDVPPFAIAVGVPCRVVAWRPGHAAEDASLA
ncbi:MAG TPA: acyltransferase [Chloroflexota bacterium]|jgi:acetyltransferase-like isoleucine patch superfamily enzyme